MTTESKLSEVLSEFARTLVTDYPIQSILDHLVGRIADLLPVGSAGVTLISDDNDAQHLAASDESALRFVRLQTEMGEGPCIEAYQTGEAVAVPDLRQDGLFPAFSKRALEEGLRAVFSFPLRHDVRRLGALDLYRQTVGALSAADLATAQTLADVVTAYILNAQARSDLQLSADDAHYGSLHDALTGLPNRTLFIQRLDHAMLRCRRTERIVAVLFADLDQFKVINDSYGHHVGDELLTAVAKRLTSLIRPGDTVARLSGDEFVILCEDLDDSDQVDPLAARFDSALAAPFALSVGEIQISASVGIAYAGHADNLPEAVLEEADAAMYQAKRQGGARHAIVDLREHRLTNHRARLNRDLRGALVRGELRADYQPIVATPDGSLAGVEALLRWEHPAHGIVGPDMAVPLAEQSGLITEIGQWMLERACLDQQRWSRNHDNDKIGVAVNVSARQIMDPAFANSVSAVLAETGVNPRLVTLEVTETVLARDSERAHVVLGDLKKLGVKLALDDFGTGFSSLGYLKQFPVDVVKLDRMFIADLERDVTSRHIVSAVVGLAHALDMVVVAEGIESPMQYEAAKSLGCDFCQGFYFSHPRSADAIDGLVAANTALPAGGPTIWPATLSGGSKPAMQALRVTTDAAQLSRWRRRPAAVLD